MKRSVRALSTIVALCAFAPSAAAQDLPNYNAYYEAKPAAPTLTAAARGVVGRFAASFDEQRGVPAFFWAPREGAAAAPHISIATPEQAARGHLARYAAVYGLSAAALATASVTHVHDLGHGGIVVTFRQKVAGIELYRNDAKVLMRQNLELVALSGSLHPAAVEGMQRSPRKFSVAPEAALAKALSDLHSLTLSAGSVLDLKKVKAQYQYFDLAPTSEVKAAKLHLVEPARVKQVFFPLPDRLVPAYFVEFISGDPADVSSDAYDYVIAADDGRVLYRQNLTHHDTFNYRVWADNDAAGRPLDGPIANFTPHPTGQPDGSFPAFVAPSLIAMDGFNKNPNNAADPWLPKGATQTKGNNVDAYTDIQAPDGFSQGDFRASITSPGAFDRVYDVSADPLVSQAQGMAAVTQIFYTTNWLHDWWYDSGFNEGAQNAQQDNYGRGGVAGDPLFAEAQDDALKQANNANMNPMSDGASPRMQMYLWDGKGQASLSIQPQNKSFTTVLASFGPTAVNLTAGVVLGVDGAAPVNDGCEAFTNSVAGKIVLIDRGKCTFAQKAQNAQNAGAAGVILANNVANQPPPGMPNTNPPLTITIPMCSVTQADGAALKAALQAGAVTATLIATAGVRPDGTIDNAVVAHEWGHYLHLRQVACGNAACGAESEGWGDYNAAQMVLRPEDDLDGTFALAIYATPALGDAGYFGIRRYPYSVDFTKNALTFRHISNGEALPSNTPTSGAGSPDNAEPHNAGEIWATMLFEAYVALLKTSKGPNPAHTFAEARRLMSDYVEAGLQLAPQDPTYTEQRDAILASAAATDVNDFVTLAEAFAKRGAGTCAKSPPRDSKDFAGVVESFVTSPEISNIKLTIDDSVTTCDKDGVLDAGEKGKVVISLENTGTAPLTSTTAVVSSLSPGVSFPAGATVKFGVVQPFETATATVEIALASTVKGISPLDLDVDVTEPAACTPKQQSHLSTQANYDDIPASSATDTVESNNVAWTAASVGGPKDVWAREAGATGHVWHGVDFASNADSTLESPPLNVGSAGPFSVSFKHRYSFEADAQDNWDGGVIEVSTDNGMSWTDIGAYGKPFYSGVIGNKANNPLATRQAYVGKSPAYPDQTQVTINLGNGLAGKTVKLRFRIGSDDAMGDFGWELDDIAFKGITNTPFSSLVDNKFACGNPPVAQAGPDQVVFSGQVVTLDASKSYDPDKDALSFDWKEIAGPKVGQENSNLAQSTFTAPFVTDKTTITFQVAVSAGGATATDTVDILVVPQPPMDTTASSSGAGGSAPKPDPIEFTDCGCETPGSATSPRGALLFGLGALLLARRRRRG